MGDTKVKVFRQELTPIHFLERAGDIFADRVAVVDGDVRYDWRAFRARSRRLASALRASGLGKGDRVAFLAVNSEPLLLAHFGVPLAGGVLVAINIRLSPEEIDYIVTQSGSTMIFYSPGARAPALKSIVRHETHRHRSRIREPAEPGWR